jgi:hypothetical protein
MIKHNLVIIIISIIIVREIVLEIVVKRQQEVR